MLLTGEHTDVSLPMQDFVSVHVVAVAAVTLMVLLATATVLLLLPPFSLLCQSAAARLLLPLYAVFMLLVYQDAQQLHYQLCAIKSGATWLSTMHIEVHVLPDQRDIQHPSLGGQCNTAYPDISTNLC